MRAAIYGLLLVLTLTIVGCGGDSEDKSFTGTWEGNFQTITGPATARVIEVGSVTLNVASNGTVTGSGVNTTTNQTFDVTGTISNTGATNLVFTYPTETFRRTGTLQRTFNKIVGTIGTRSDDPGTGTVSFDVTMVSGAAVDP